MIFLGLTQLTSTCSTNFEMSNHEMLQDSEDEVVLTESESMQYEV